MYKDSKRKTEYQRDYMRKKRSNKTPKSSNNAFIPYHIVEKLADEKWREILTSLKISFEDSHNPNYASNVCFCECGTDLSQVFDWLEVTG